MLNICDMSSRTSSGGHEVALQVVNSCDKAAERVEVGRDLSLQAVNSCDMSSRTSRGGARVGDTSGEQLRYEQQKE